MKTRSWMTLVFVCLFCVGNAFAEDPLDSFVSVYNNTNHDLEIVVWMVDQYGNIMEGGSVGAGNVGPQQKEVVTVRIGTSFRTNYCPRQFVRVEVCPNKEWCGPDSEHIMSKTIKLSCGRSYSWHINQPQSNWEE